MVLVRRRQRPALRGDAFFDCLHFGFGFIAIAVGDLPAHAFRHMAAHEQNHQTEQRADKEADPPAQIFGKDGRVEKDQRRERAERGADPVGAVDVERDSPAQPRRHELIDGGIDRRVFAADAGARDHAEGDETPQVPGEGGEQRAHEIDREGNEEEQPPAVTVGEITKDERAADGADQVTGGGKADFPRGKAEGAGVLQHTADGADQCHLQTVEDPGHAERDDQHQVETAPGQPVEPRRYERGDACGRKRSNIQNAAP